MMHHASNQISTSSPIKYLILHADDLGLAQSVNEATLTAMANGWVDQFSSVMVPCPYFEEVAEHVRRRPELDIGVHLTLTSEWTKHRWKPLSPIEAVASLVDADGYLWSDVEQFRSHAVPEQVECEVHTQVQRAIESGIRVSHLDSHMLALLRSTTFVEILMRVAHRYGVPFLLAQNQIARYPNALTIDEDDVVLDALLALRPASDEAAVQTLKRDGSSLHGASKWLAAYATAIRGIGAGISQMIFHLGYDNAELRSITLHRAAWGALWRQRDFDVLAGRPFKAYLEDNNVTVVSWEGRFADLWRAPSELR